MGRGSKLSPCHTSDSHTLVLHQMLHNSSLATHTHILNNSSLLFYLTRPEWNLWHMWQPHCGTPKNTLYISVPSGVSLNCLVSYTTMPYHTIMCIRVSVRITQYHAIHVTADLRDTVSVWWQWWMRVTQKKLWRPIKPVVSKKEMYK